MIIMPITRPAASALSEATFRPNDIAPARECRAPRDSAAKKPSTTVGMPARISSKGLANARKRGRCILGHVDRREQADRTGDQHGDERDQQGADDQRDDAEGAGGADLIGAHGGLRRPLQAEQEVDRRNLAGRSGRSRTAPRTRCRSWSAPRRRRRRAGHLDEALELIAGAELGRSGAQTDRRDRASRRPSRRRASSAVGPGAAPRHRLGGALAAPRWLRRRTGRCDRDRCRADAAPRLQLVVEDRRIEGGKRQRLDDASRPAACRSRKSAASESAPRRRQKRRDKRAGNASSPRFAQAARRATGRTRSRRRPERREQRNRSRSSPRSRMRLLDRDAPLRSGRPVTRPRPAS